jgi:biotin transport system substrate-specific component
VAVAGSLTLSAKISIPFFPVPLTMTTFVVIGLGLALGSRLGTAAFRAISADGEREKGHCLLMGTGAIAT